jgi:hypothetical protein
VKSEGTLLYAYTVYRYTFVYAIYSLIIHKLDGVWVRSHNLGDLHSDPLPYLWRDHLDLLP